jgi:spermidine synthase
MELVGSAANVRRAVAAAGAASLLAQVVLLRELLAFSQGNELVVGAALGAWLCLTAVASALGARPGWDASRARTALSLLLGLAPLGYLAALALTTAARPDALGDAVAAYWILGVSALAMLPACAVGGFAFAWGIKASGDGSPATALYVAETAAAAGAGLLFHLLLGEHLHGAWILVIGGACCAVAAVLLAGGRARWRLFLPVGALVTSLGLAPSAAELVDRAHFPGESVLAVRPSRYGQLAVLARGDQRVFAQDGVLLFTSEDRIIAEETAHLPMLLHPSPRRVLLLGGGLGGGLVEVLRHAPERVDYAEVDPGLLALVGEFGAADTRAALSDPRVHVAAADGRGLLRQPDHPYDVILAQAPVPQNALMARYSTRECFDDARRALAPGGVFVVVTPGSDTHLGEAARQRHAAILASLKSVFPFVAVAPGDPTFLWSAEREVDARPSLLATRLRERGLQPVRVGPTWLFDRLLPMHVASYQRAVTLAAPTVSRDFRPVVYLLGLLESLQRLSPTVAKVAMALRASPRAWLAGAALVGLASLAWAVRRKRSAPALAVAVAGGVGMSLQLVLAVAYQALRGHLYHALGLMLATSMAGMAIGAHVAARIAARGKLGRALAWGAGATVVTAAVLSLAPMAPGFVSFAIVPLLFLVGAATGAVYPLAVQSSTHEGGARLYAWDLVGAAGAAFLTSVVAIPLLGLVAVTLAFAVLAGIAAAANIAKA